MRKPKIYLETTMFNYYFDKDRDAHADTVALFKDIQSEKYEAYTSIYVTDELVKAEEPKRSNMLALITEYNVTVLPASTEADSLADVYVTEGIIPQKYRTDGIHIAVTTVNDLDIIVSMNFQHIVKRKTILATGKTNNLYGYRAIEIYSPMEVIDNENT
jgi:predicted nucleic acid-binding protein